MLYTQLTHTKTEGLVRQHTRCGTRESAGQLVKHEAINICSRDLSCDNQSPHNRSPQTSYVTNFTIVIIIIIISSSTKFTKQTSLANNTTTTAKARGSGPSIRIHNQKTLTIIGSKKVLISPHHSPSATLPKQTYFLLD